MVRRLCLLLCLLFAVPAFAQSSGGSAYAVGGIDVDVRAGSPGAARLAAWRIAQRKAWPLLWSRLTGREASAAPRLSDGQLDGIVAGIESQGERFSSNRYIARLGVVFDRSRASDWLAGAGGLLQSPPMLLLPVLVEAGAATVYQARTPWRAAWQRYAENVTPIDYVLASGSAGDNLVLTGWQTQRPDRATWRDILARFDTADVLVAEARLTRLWPGGPVRALVIARHGPDATELGRFTLQARTEESLDELLDQSVARVDAIFSAALRDGRLRAAPDLTLELPTMADIAMLEAPLAGSGEGSATEAPVASFDLSAATPDAASAAAIESLLRTTPGVASVTVTGLSVGGSSRYLVGYGGSFAELAQALDARGWRLATENGATLLRRRRPGEAALPPPAPPPPPPTSPKLPGPAAAPAVLPSAPRPAAPAPAAPATTGAPPRPGEPARRPGATPALRPRPPAESAAPPPAEPTRRERSAPVDLLPPRNG